MTRVKICGTRTREDVEAGVRAGADALGFVVEYPDPVPWNLDRERAGELLEAVPPFVSTVLVTTGTAEAVVDLARNLGPDAVQLHGDESVATVEEVAATLGPRGVGTLKAVSVGDEDDAREVRSFARDLASVGVDGLVLDAEADDRQGGGTGETIPWNVACRIAAEVDVPVVLAGGLTPDNVGEAIATVEPYAVDVISGVEGDEHRKDPERTAAFVDAVRSG